VSQKRPKKTRFQPYLSEELRRQIALYSAKRGVGESALTEDLLTRALNGTDDQTLLYRRLDKVSRQVQRLSQQVELHGQFLCEFAQLWLHNTPPLPGPDQHATRRQAQAAYQRLLERTAAAVSSGKTFIDELPKDDFSTMGSAGAVEQ